MAEFKPSNQYLSDHRFWQSAYNARAHDCHVYVAVGEQTIFLFRSLVEFQQFCKTRFAIVQPHGQRRMVSMVI
jgi:predicted amidohydrolase